MTRITFLLPTYNRASFLAESLGAIEAQLGDDDELLVIDDGSTDATSALSAGFSARVRYVRQHNAGKSAALNHGMRISSGAFVMICDDDDILRPGAVEALVQSLETSRAGFAFGRYSRFREDAAGRRIDLGTGYWPDLSQGSMLRHILEDAFVMQNAALVRRAAYREAGSFDEKMLRSLDYDMFVRLALRTHATFVDRCIFDQRKHDGIRGPSQALHSAERSESVWQAYDREIFLKLQNSVDIEFYESLFEGTNMRQVRRAALLQRACVNARHDLWHLAVEDLEAAARVAPELPLAQTQADIAARMLNGKHGFAGALQPDLLARLKRLACDAGVGRSIIRAMLAGGLWRLRPPLHEDVRTMRRLSQALVGSRRTLVLLAGRKLRRARRDTLSGTLVERREPALHTGPWVRAA